MTNNNNSISNFPNKKRLKHQSKKAELEFQKIVADAGCSEKTTDELWKWFDSSEKKGAANF